MVIDLRKYLAVQNETGSVSYQVHIDDTGVNGEKLFPAPVSADAGFSGFSGTVRLKLQLKSEMVTVCDRCGKELHIPIELDSWHILTPELAEADNEGEMIEVDMAAFDLDELVYSDIMLSLPTKILCREDCKGLCPECGRDLSTGSCDCDKKKVDPRMEILRRLLDEDSSNFEE